MDKAHLLKGHMPGERMKSLAMAVRSATLKCCTMSSELQQTALSEILRYLCVLFAALQEIRIRDQPVISVGDYNIYCVYADEEEVGSCAIAVRNDYKNLVEEFGSTSTRFALYGCSITEDANSGSYELMQLRGPLKRKMKTLSMMN
ncbi:hypothetical protein RB195_022586 [Necator americanus]|uniref:Uncharacterized protein n=1 Tax=Necator americanus TaxID=51031 RepID=A0ABR1EGH9_NECAM